MVKVLALDVGFASLGWAAIDAATGGVCCAGVIRTVKSQAKRGVRVADDDCRRCAEQALALDALLARFNPACVVAEVPTGGSLSARATRAMALGTGIACGVLAVRGVPCEFTTPRDGKLAATGNAGAGKPDVEAGVMHRVPGARALLDAAKRADREHISDACAAWLVARGGQLVMMAARGGGAS